MLRPLNGSSMQSSRVSQLVCSSSTDVKAPRSKLKQIQSPPAFIAQKSKELQDIGPGCLYPQGLSGCVKIGAAALPLWAGALLQIGVTVLKSPFTAFRKDPSAFKLKEPFPLHEENVTVNGIRLHCVSPGRRNPDKPLMLMVHGFPECWYSWRHQMKEFADDYDVVAVDMRGYNDSDKPVGRDQYRLSTLASDIKELVGALGHKTCTLVAHDWGGVVSWVTAGMFGEALVDKLIVLALPHVGVMQTNFTPAQKKRSEYILLFQAPWIPETSWTLNNAAAMDAVFRQQPHGVKNSSAMTDDDAAWYRAACLKPGAMTGMLNYYRAYMDVHTNKPDEAAWR
eukprot:jgi/Chrzof1/2173/Cz11g04280.t1